MTWTEGYRVAAYKADLFCDYCVCLSFARPDGIGLTLDEDMAGWEPFCAALPQFLLGCSAMPSLFADIPYSPATATLYTRAARQSS